MPAKSAVPQGAGGAGGGNNFPGPLFWFKFVFLAEILVAEALIVYRMKRRHGFAWRLALTLALLLGFTFALPVPFYNAIYSSALFMAIFLATLPALKLCFDESWGNIVFCGFFSYTEQHISYQLYNFFCIVAGLDASSNLYGDSFVGDLNGLQVLAFAVTHVLVYLAGWAVLKYRTERQNGGVFSVRRIKSLVASIVIVSVNVILNAFVVYDLPSDASPFISAIIIFYNIFSCVLALGMQIAVLGREEVEGELKFVEDLWNKNKQIYELSKENVDFINMKCHDLRHRIRNARKRPFIDENELKEIEQAVDIYDGILQTGNEVLDVVLSEESVFCSRNGIHLVCNIDGAPLSFMQPADIYAIFQNALHNAIDAVLKFPESDRRVVRLNVWRKANMISVHMENEVAEGESVRFENGLPVTNSPERNLHGFGMRSIRASVERYNGCVLAEMRDGSFCLDIMIPVPAAAAVGGAAVQGGT